MRGRIFSKIAIAICLIVIGWISCLLFKDWALLSLDLSISIADVLAIIIEILLAVFITKVLENSIQESRVEKDFFISDLSRVEEIFTDLDKSCSGTNNTLSLNAIVCDISRAKRILNKCWQLLELYDKSFSAKNQKDYDAVIQSIKDVDSRLTDSTFYIEKDGFSPVKIDRGKIYLNGTVKSDIENSLSLVKSNVFKLKVAINKK